VERFLSAYKNTPSEVQRRRVAITMAMVDFT